MSDSNDNEYIYPAAVSHVCRTTLPLAEFVGSDHSAEREDMMRFAEVIYGYNFKAFVTWSSEESPKPSIRYESRPDNWDYYVELASK